MSRTIRAPRGTQLTCRNWLIEAAYRMLQNNLDPQVAGDPEHLIVYGGRGKAARNWESFEAILESLRRLAPEETLLVQSGKPVAVFSTHEDAPRVLIANSNIVPAWVTQENFDKWEQQGLIMYGLAPSRPGHLFGLSRSSRDSDSRLMLLYWRDGSRHRERTVEYEVHCSDGGQPGTRVHSSYQRKPNDLAAAGYQIQLRLVHHSDLPSLAVPRFLRVDDWAWKKLQTFGMIPVDLEQHRVVDLLPDRSADSLAEWLKNHPGVQIISRDRGGTYAEGARRGAPMPSKLQIAFTS